MAHDPSAATVDLAVYDDGQRRPGRLELEDAFEACRVDGSFVWVGLREPTAGQFAAVQREFGLHELAVEDAIEAQQRPKLEVYGSTVFVVLKTLRSLESEEVVSTGEVMLFVNPRFVISVRHGGSSAVTEARARLEGDARLLRHGPAAVLYGVLDRVVDDYESVAVALEAAIEVVERRVFSDTRDNAAGAIYHLEREVADFHHAVAPLTPVLDRLLRADHGFVPDDLRSYVRDVQDHQLRMAQRVAGFRERLTSLLQANLAQVTVVQNSDMRQISAWVAIIAVPTMIAGIYGMNFDVMPELDWQYGYPLVVAVMVVICTALWFRFRRVGWL